MATETRKLRVGIFVIAAGDPKDLRDHSDDERVRGFFNRQPGPEFRDRRKADVH